VYGGPKITSLLLRRQMLSIFARHQKVSKTTHRIETSGTGDEISNAGSAVEARKVSKTSNIGF
jgi:hypothetical protein